MLCALLLTGAATAAEEPADTTPRIPLASGLVIVAVLQFPEGDRENVITVERATATGAEYSWQYVEYQDGVQVESGTFTRFVRAEDLAAATRLHTLYKVGDQADYPGYTAFSVSSAAFEALRTTGEAAYSVVEWSQQDLPEGMLARLPGMLMIGGLLSHSIRLRGSLYRMAEEPEPFEVLLNGERIVVPALRARGRFAYQDRHREADYWMLADAAHPLLLRMTEGEHAWQVIRIDLPDAIMAGTSGMESVDAPAFESQLAEECRAELAGVYFAFGTAELHDASRERLGEVHRLLARHPDWALTVEGHTDSIGDDASNLRLSQARAEAVVGWLSQQGIAANRLGARGYGASQPRESNDTIEGRARNRRVEITRTCD
jgi:outer membrane protein OmpA-like peptidoglycan-associated protein